MKFLLFILISLSVVTGSAGTKDVLKRIPGDYDYVLCLRLPELLKNEKLSKRMLNNKDYEKFREQMAKKIGLTEKDILSVYIGGVAAQYERMRSWQELSKKEFDTSVYVEVGKSLELKKLKQEFPDIFANEKIVNGITCVQFKDEKMKNAYLAFLTPNLLMLTSDHQLPKLTKLAVENSLLADSEAKRLLTTNGFGGAFSLVHWGEIGEVHPMTPWMKNYTGGSFNLYFEESQEISAECTLTFNDIQSVKSASLLVNMGMSFLDFKPELAQLKKMIAFKAYEKNLLLDVTITEASWNTLSKAFSNMSVQRTKRRSK